MNRSRFCFAVPFVLAFASQLLAAESSKPNIVMIVSDDQGWNDAGWNDSEIRTPHLDKLAKAGVTLDWNYVYPTCSPTRVGLLFGRNPEQLGVLGPIAGRSTQHLSHDLPSLPGELRKTGYFTALSGKWHLGLQQENGPKQYGFDSTYGYLHGQIDPYTHLYKNGDRTWHRDDKLIEEKGHATDLITDEAVRVIADSRGEKPFFLYVAYSVPHFPLDEPAEYVEPYRDSIEDESRRNYAASLTHMDEGIGRIVKALDDSGQRKNTILIYTSDNGGQKSWSSKTQYGGKFPPHDRLGDNSPLRGGKDNLYEGGIHVPGLVNWPGKLEPHNLELPVAAWDWMPTLLHYAGTEPLAPRFIDGVNVAEALETGDQTSLGDRTLYWRIRKQRAIRQGWWKLIGTDSNGERNFEWELFNLEEDPNETRDLSREKPEVAATLRETLESKVSVDAE